MRGSHREPWREGTAEAGGSEGTGKENNCAPGARTTSCVGFWEVYVLVGRAAVKGKKALKVAPQDRGYKRSMPLPYSSLEPKISK